MEAAEVRHTLPLHTPPRSRRDRRSAGFSIRPTAGRSAARLLCAAADASAPNVDQMSEITVSAWRTPTVLCAMRCGL